MEILSYSYTMKYIKISPLTSQLKTNNGSLAHIRYYIVQSYSLINKVSLSTINWTDNWY